jgi:hypothetical protein
MTYALRTYKHTASICVGVKTNSSVFGVSKFEIRHYNGVNTYDTNKQHYAC